MRKTRKALALFDDYYEMMSDGVRMRAYEAAIARAVEPGDVVIDLGAGLGILALLALRAGAARVYAIEQGPAIELARAVVERNGLGDRVRFVAQNSKDFELDEPADVIVSETLGSFAVDENTLDFTIDARTRLLRPGGRLVPEALRLYLAPVTAPEAARRFDSWSRVCGFDFTPARDECVSRMSVVNFEPKDLLGPAQLYAELDLHTLTEATLAAKRLLPLTRAGTLHGVAGWFEAQLCEGVRFETSPSAPPTHWRQALFPFRAPVEVIRGDVLELSLEVGPEDPRSDNTSIRYDYRCTQLARELGPKPVARNAPCPCGSGRKHKRCCGRGP